MYVTQYAQDANQQQSIGFIPRIYEDVPVEPTHWEYYILTVDIYESSLPNVDHLNALGNEGWLLNSILHEGRAGDAALVHYYFVRERKG